MQKTLIFAVAALTGLTAGLYFALASKETPGANMPQVEFATFEGLRRGDMLKLQFEVRRGSAVPFTHEDGSELTLADFEGKWLILNFWATWCAPCRKEMPHLSELQASMGADDFQVLTIASGPNQRPAMERFLAEINVDNLPLHTDLSSAFSRDMGILGLPVTIVMHPEGYEVARLIGDANWGSDNAKEILQSMMQNL